MLFGVHTPFSHINGYNKLATERFCYAGFAASRNSGYPLLYNNKGAKHPPLHSSSCISKQRFFLGLEGSQSLKRSSELGLALGHRKASNRGKNAFLGFPDLKNSLPDSLLNSQFWSNGKMGLLDPQSGPFWRGK